MFSWRFTIVSLMIFGILGCGSSKDAPITLEPDNLSAILKAISTFENISPATSTQVEISLFSNKNKSYGDYLNTLALYPQNKVFETPYQITCNALRFTQAYEGKFVKKRKPDAYKDSFCTQNEGSKASYLVGDKHYVLVSIKQQAMTDHLAKLGQVIKLDTINQKRALRISELTKYIHLNTPQATPLLLQESIAQHYSLEPSTRLFQKVSDEAIVNQYFKATIFYLADASTTCSNLQLTNCKSIEGKSNNYFISTFKTP